MLRPGAGALVGAAARSALARRGCAEPRARPRVAACSPRSRGIWPRGGRGPIHAGAGRFAARRLAPGRRAAEQRGRVKRGCWQWAGGCGGRRKGSGWQRAGAAERRRGAAWVPWRASGRGRRRGPRQGGAGGGGARAPPARLLDQRVRLPHADRGGQRGRQRAAHVPGAQPASPIPMGRAHVRRVCSMTARRPATAPGDLVCCMARPVGSVGTRYMGARSVLSPQQGHRSIGA
jgi:hypothetical protein